MIATLRLLVCAVAMALAGTILELAHPGWVNELATDLWALPNIRSKLHEELDPSPKSYAGARFRR